MAETKPLVLKGEDGKEYEFPNGTPKQKVADYMTKVGVKPVERISGDYGGFKAPKTAFQKQAASRKLGIEVDQHAATQEQDISNAKAKFAGDVTKAIPVAATLATGGLAAPVSIALMGGASAIAGTYSEAAKLALGADDTSGHAGLTGMGAKNAPSGGAATSPQQLARRLGVDFALGAAAQGATLMTGKLLEIAGDKVLKPMVARAAAKSDQGQSILGEYGGKLLNKMRSADVVSGAKVSIDPEINKLESAIALRRTGPSDAFKELWGGSPLGGPALSPDKGGLATKLYIWSVQDGTPAGLAEIKGELSQAAFKRAGLNFEERVALKAFSKSLDSKLGQAYEQTGQKHLYDGFKEVQGQMFRFQAGVQLAEQTLKSIGTRAGHMMTGAVGGGAYGGIQGSRKGGVSGAVSGAATGAVLGAVGGAVTKTAEDAIFQKGAPWLLERLLSDKAVAPAARQAIQGMANGDTKGAISIFTKAASQIGADKLLKNFMKQMAEDNAPEKAAAPK